MNKSDIIKDKKIEHLITKSLKFEFDSDLIIDESI